MAPRLPILLALAIAGSVAFAAPVVSARAKAGRPPVPAAKAPPRVLEGILGLLKSSNVSVTNGSAGSEAGSASTGSLPLNDALSKSGIGANGSSPNGTSNGGSTSGGSSPGGKPVGANSRVSTTGSGDGSDDDKVSIEENNKSPVADKANAAANKGGGGNAPPEKGLRKLDNVFPVCVFVDESEAVQAKANDAIKGMVDMAAACNVQILPFPVVAHFPSRDHEIINQQQVAACDIPENLGTEGKGSTTAFVPWPDTAARMCDDFLDKEKTKPNLQVAGCAQVRAAQNKNGMAEAEAIANATNNTEMQDNIREQKKQFGDRMSTTKIAPSIEVPIGHDRVTISHEALGHSQMGRPNGKTMGNGIGEWGEKPGADVGGGDGKWSTPGCKALTDNAFPNTKNYMYDANRDSYFAPQTTRVHQLGSDPPIFSPGKNPPLPGIPQAPQIASGPDSSGGGSPGSAPGGSEAIVSRTPQTTNAGTTAVAGTAPQADLVKPKAGGRHETSGPSSAPTLSDLRQKNPPKEPPRDDSFVQITQKPGGAFVSAAAGPRESVRIDESASASTSVSSVGTGPKSSGGNIFDASSSGGGGSSGGMGGGGGKVGIDESMTANGPTAVVGNNGGGASPPKLFIGKGSPPSSGPSAFQSALSGDFFSKMNFDDPETERRRPRGNRPGRGIASEEGDDARPVRSLRR